MTSEDGEDQRWRYTEFGSDFERKYRLLRARARMDYRFVGRNVSSWQEKRVSEPLGIAPTQWSNLRSARPNKHAIVHSWQLDELARVFQLHAIVGRQAWTLFTPEVSFEEFTEALDSVGYGHHRPIASSSQDEVGFATPRLGSLALVCPATMEQYDQTARLTREIFGEDLIDLDADREAFQRNPYSMVVLIEVETEHVLGWADIYHLPEEDLSSLIASGEVKVHPERSLNFPDSCSAKRAYSASIAIHRNRRGLLRLLIYGMMEFLLRFQFRGTNEFELFAVGSNEGGTGLLKWLEFDFVRTVRMASGNHGLYSRRISKGDLQQYQRAFWHKLGLYRTDVEVRMENPLDI